ncbi:hypothetical protein DMN91_007908 [Ooceraea biroi]|uniref:Uncharacterized protein n=1 Tax=Ooceraea biroi TaxID=2015173 RepID=A0A3L8DGB2_OOCBI|nr:hypothetical protein DMN91_007908 [Ooceraea biroi]
MSATLQLNCQNIHSPDDFSVPMCMCRDTRGALSEAEKQKENRGRRNVRTYMEPDMSVFKHEERKLSKSILHSHRSGRSRAVATPLSLIAADAHVDVDAGECDAGRGCGDGTAHRTDGYIAHTRIARG